MNLGIVIPYYKNSDRCEENFKLLMSVLEKDLKLLTDDVLLVVVEDGQCSGWLADNKSDNVVIISSLINRGVSYARNVGLDYCISKDCDYILFLDSDDMIDSNYIRKILNEIGYDDIYDINFFVNDTLKEYRVSNNTRSSVCGLVIKANLIGTLRFKENIQYGEDKMFINQLIERNKDNISYGYVNTNYYYNYGSNLNSLCMRYLRHEIGIERSDNNEMS